MDWRFAVILVLIPAGQKILHLGVGCFLGDVYGAQIIDPLIRDPDRANAGFAPAACFLEIAGKCFK